MTLTTVLSADSTHRMDTATSPGNLHGTRRLVASIRPRTAKDGTVTWQVQFRLDGKLTGRTFLQRKGAVEFGQLTDRIGANAALQVLEARQGSTTVTLREYTTKYLDIESGLLTGIEPGTRYAYTQAAHRSFLVTLGDYPIDAVSKADVGRWVAWQERQKSSRGGTIAPKTIKNYHAILSAVLTSAVNNGLRPDNPAYRTRITRGVAHEGVFLSRDEIATLLHFTPQRHLGLVFFLLGSGCRWGEATAITWGDIDTWGDPPTVRISKAWKAGVGGKPVLKQPKTARSRRTISLAQNVIHTLGTPGPPDQLVFRGIISGGHLWYAGFREDVWNPTIRKAMDPELCEKEGVTPLSRRPTVHDLRHTHASGMIRRGASLVEVQRRLGHESIQTTSDRYSHLAPDTNMRMAAVSSDMLDGVLPLRQIEQ